MKAMQFLSNFDPTPEELESLGFEWDDGIYSLEIQYEVISYSERNSTWKLNDSFLDPLDFDEIIQLAYTLNRGSDYIERVENYIKEKNESN